jgi:hypothetical protein
MILKNKLKVGVIQIGAAVVLLGGVAGATATRQMTNGSDNVPGDISGHCDEAEHAADTDCFKLTLPTSVTTMMTMVTTDDHGTHHGVNHEVNHGVNHEVNHDLNDDKGGQRASGISDDSSGHGSDDWGHGGHGSDD